MTAARVGLPKCPMCNKLIINPERAASVSATGAPMHDQCVRCPHVVPLSMDCEQCNNDAAEWTDFWSPCDCHYDEQECGAAGCYGGPG